MSKNPNTNFIQSQNTQKNLEENKNNKIAENENEYEFLCEAQNKIEKENSQKWIIDTDPGVDDAFAILLAMTYLKKDLLALSIANGNVGIEGCFKNAKKICAIKNCHVPVYKGSLLNLSGLKFEASDFHGKDGLLEIEDYKGFEEKYKFPTEKNFHFGENSKENSDEKKSLIEKYSPLKIIELSYKYPKKLNILAIAPLTNIALALMLDPSLPERLNKLVIMGGSYSSLGNIKSNVEFNFASDPIAAKKVFSAFNLKHNEIILYPWETCLEYLITSENLPLMKSLNSETKNFMEKIIIKKDTMPENGIFADFGSAVYITNPQSVKKSQKRFVDISIDSDGSAFGQFILENDYSLKFRNRRYSTNSNNSNYSDHGNNALENVNFENEEMMKGRKKVEIIMNLDKEIYYESFRKMGEC